jgi:hypothetical protein
MQRYGRCDVCNLPDLHNGQGDGIGSCECPRCECGQADLSDFCTCPPEDFPGWDPVGIPDDVSESYTVTEGGA